MPLSDKKRLEIHVALQDGVRQFLADLPSEELYGLMFSSSAEGYYALAVAGTEESLTQTARSYVEQGYSAKTGDALPQLRDMLRWSGEDDGWYGLHDNHCAKANELLKKACDDGQLEYFDGQLHDICVDVLKKLKGQGAFNKETEDNNVILGITFGFFEDSSPPFVEAANSTEVYRRFLAELELGYEASENIPPPARN